MELPPGYAACSQGQDSRASSFSLLGRLLGGLARGEGQSAFNPLRRGDWQSLLPWETRDPSSASVSHDEANAEQASSSPLVPAHGGAEGPPADPAPDAETAGWTRLSIDLADGGPSVVVVRRAAISTAGWTLFLALVALGAWGLFRRPAAWLSATIALGLFALLLPEAIAVIFSHGLLGMLFCLFVALVRRRMAAAVKPAALPRSEVPSTLTNIVPFGAPLAAIAMLCAADCAAGEAARPSPATRSVFIPVDEKQQPTKGKYFLPESFYAELYRRAALHAEKPQGWMIAAAVYRAALADNPAQTGHVVDHLTAEFEIRVFNEAARVRIPLRRDEVSLEPGRALLDDRTVQPEWEADGNGLSLDIAEPGEYRLELSLRLASQPAERRFGFDLAIPRAPTSRLEFGVPTGGPQVSFPSALGAARWEEGLSRWTVDLGPASRLAATWQDAAPAGTGVAADVEQLLWLKVEPACVLLDARMKVKVPTGMLHRLLVRADSALELLPSADPGAPVVQVRGGGALQTYEIQWPQPVAAAMFDLHFVYSGASSAGTFHVPQIDVVDAGPVRRLLAVSIDPALEYQLPGPRSQESGAVDDFVRRWGANDAPPELAFRLDGAAADWNLLARLRRPETSGDQAVKWIFHAQTAEVRLDAQLTTAGGSIFQYRLEAPPALHVESIAVLTEGVNQAAPLVARRRRPRHRLSRRPPQRTPRIPTARPDAAARKRPVGFDAAAARRRADPELAGGSLPRVGCAGRSLGRRRACQRQGRRRR